MAYSGERASVFQNVKVAPETTPGTAPSSGYKKLAALGFMPTINPTIKQFRPAGQKYTTVTALNREETTWALEGIPTYTEIVYPLSSVLSEAEITAASGTTSAAAGSRTMGADGTHWFFKPSAGDADAPVSYTVYKGSITGVERATYVRVNEFTLTVNRNDTTLGGSALGRSLSSSVITNTLHMPGNEVQTVTVDASGGTFTITYAGQTTAAIAYNASAATVLAALEALSNIPKGALRVEKTTDSGDDHVWRIEFGGSLGETNVAEVTCSGASLTGGAGTATPATVTAGAAITTLGLVPILPTQVCVYAFSSAQTDISTTTNETDTYKLTDMMELSLTIGNRYGPYYTLNCDLDSFDTMVEVTPTMQLTTRMQANSEGLAYLTQLRNGGTVFFRVKATGDTITSAETYEFTMDFAGKVSASSEIGDQDGVYALTWTWDAVPELTNGGPLEIAVVNNVTAL